MAVFSLFNTCHYTVGMSEKFSDVVQLMTVPELKFMLRELRLAVVPDSEWKQGNFVATTD